MHTYCPGLKKELKMFTKEQVELVMRGKHEDARIYNKLTEGRINYHDLYCSQCKSSQ